MHALLHADVQLHAVFTKAVWADQQFVVDVLLKHAVQSQEEAVLEKHQDCPDAHHAVVLLKHAVHWHAVDALVKPAVVQD